MKAFCPDERYFVQALTKAKAALRKCRTRYNEDREKNKTPSNRQ